MKIKFLFVIAVLTAFLAVGTMSFKASEYKPRTASKIEDVLAYQVPGGKIAAGMTEYFDALRSNPLTGTVSEAEYMAAINASLKIQSKSLKPPGKPLNPLKLFPPKLGLNHP